MSWQEELRKLDEELAAGRISADDYRVRRDQVLSSAVSTGSDADTGNQGEPKAEATQFIQPVSPSAGQQADSGEPTTSHDAEKTQVVPGDAVPNQGPGGDSERTQTVSGWTTERPSGDADRTQVVPGVPPQSIAGGHPPRPAPPGPHGGPGSPPAGFPQPQQGGAWPGQPEQPEELSPPWAGSDFPPLAAASTSPDWVRQGPEVFEEGGRSRTLKALGIAGVAVLLVGIAVAAYFLFRPEGGTPPPVAESTEQQAPTGTTSQTQPPTTTTTQEPQGPITALPGEVRDYSHVKTFADVQQLEYLTGEEIQIYKKGKPSEAAFSISTDGQYSFVILVVRENSPATAEKARNQLTRLQRSKYGMKAIDGPANVAVSGTDKHDRGPLRRAHYASDGYVVRVQVQGSDAGEVDTYLSDILDAQLELLPANG